MNKAILIGRLCADPEIRSTQSGKQVASYRLAVNRPFKQDGQQEADFLPCIAWGNYADFAAKYLKKGLKIAVEGHIQTRTYDDSAGKKIYVTEIIVERQEFCESKPGTGQAETAQESHAEEPPLPAANGFVKVDDDELPF